MLQGTQDNYNEKIHNRLAIKIPSLAKYFLFIFMNQPRLMSIWGRFNM